MALKDQIESDLAATLFNTDEFAQEITYTPRGGSAETINAALGSNIDAYVESEIAEYARKSLEITVPRSASGGIPNPDKDDTVTINDVEFAVIRVVRQDTWIAVLEIARITIGDRRGDNYHSGQAGR